MAKAKKQKTDGQTAKRTRPALAEREDTNGVAVVQLATRVPKTVYRQLKLYAVSNSENISTLVAQAIADLLQKRGWKEVRQ